MVVKKMTKKEAEQVQQTQTILSVLDVGYGFTKLISSIKPELVVIPSTVSIGSASTASNVLNSNNEVNLDELVVEVDGVRSYVGTRAMNVFNDLDKRTTAVNRAKDPMSRLLFQTAIALTLPDEDGTYENIHLVTGLPNKDYDTTVKDDLEAFLLEPFTIKIYVNKTDYIEKEIKVSSVSIHRQPFGTYAYHQHALGNVEAGQPLIMNKPGYKSILGIIDIGHVTTDYCLFVNGDVEENNKTLGSTDGVSQVYKELEELVTIMLRKNDHTRFKLKESDLDNAILEKTINMGSLEYDVESEVSQAVDVVSRTMTSTILKKWDNHIEHLEEVIISGGGAELFDGVLDKELSSVSKQTFKKVDGAQFANLLGFYMLGVLELLEEIGDPMEVYLEYVKGIFGGNE